MAVRVTVIAKRARTQRARDIELVVADAEATLSPWTRALLDCLRPTCREVFVLREVGRPGTWIAEQLGISSQRVYALHAEAAAAMADAARRASELIRLRALARNRRR